MQANEGTSTEAEQPKQRLLDFLSGTGGDGYMDRLLGKIHSIDEKLAAAAAIKFLDTSRWEAGETGCSTETEVRHLLRLVNSTRANDVLTHTLAELGKYGSEDGATGTPPAIQDLEMIHRMEQIIDIANLREHPDNTSAMATIEGLSLSTRKRIAEILSYELLVLRRVDRMEAPGEELGNTDPVSLRYLQGSFDKKIKEMHQENEGDTLHQRLDAELQEMRGAWAQNEDAIHVLGSSQRASLIQLCNVMEALAEGDGFTLHDMLILNSDEYLDAFEQAAAYFQETKQTMGDIERKVRDFRGRDPRPHTFWNRGKDMWQKDCDKLVEEITGEAWRIAKIVIMPPQPERVSRGNYAEVFDRQVLPIVEGNIRHATYMAELTGNWAHMLRKYPDFLQRKIQELCYRAASRQIQSILDQQSGMAGRNEALETPNDFHHDPSVVTV